MALRWRDWVCPPILAIMGVTAIVQGRLDYPAGHRMPVIDLHVRGPWAVVIGIALILLAVLWAADTWRRYCADEDS